MELHAYPHLQDTHWDDDLFVILSWSPSGASLEPFSQTHIFRHLDIIMLLLVGNASLMFGSDIAMDLEYRDHTFDDRWLDVTWFSDLSHIRCHTRAYSVSDEIYRSSWSCMFIPTYGMHAETMTCSLSYHGPSMGSLLSNSARRTLFGI